MSCLTDYVRMSVLSLAAALAIATPAKALLISPGFDSTITGDVNAVQKETAINDAIAAIDALYADAGTIRVLFKFDGSSGGASSSNAITTVPYSSGSGYRAALAADSTAHPNNTVLATALAGPALPASTPASAANGIEVNVNLWRVALGATGITPCFDTSGNFVGGCHSTYDSVVTIGALNYASNGPSNNSQAVSVIEHELDEVLGGGGAGSTLNQSPVNVLGPLDLYRYQASGASCGSVTTIRSYTTNSSEVACLSFDGGTTSLVQMNQAGGGSDFGDFANVGPLKIQDAFTSGGDVIQTYTTVSPEYQMTLSIGYDPRTSVSAPEPATVILFSAALATLGLARRRGRTAQGE